MALLALGIGRILLAIVFIASGVSKLQQLEQTGSMMTGVGLPAYLAMPTGVFELVAGAALAVGVLPRLVPLLLAGFTLLTILYFHANVDDPMQAVQAMKNVAIIGGLFAVLAASHERRTSPALHTPVQGNRLVAAEERAHAAELRAARAEGAADAGAASHPRAEDRTLVEDRAHADTVRAGRGDRIADPAAYAPLRRPWFRRWF